MLVCKIIKVFEGIVVQNMLMHVIVSLSTPRILTMSLKDLALLENIAEIKVTS